MIFQSQISQGPVPPDKELTTDTDEYSIGSTFSANPQVHKFETDGVTPFDQQHNKWHVVSTSNKIPKKPKQDYAPPRPMQYDMIETNTKCEQINDIHQKNFDWPEESGSNYSYNVLPKTMQFSPTTNKFIPDSIRAVAKANIELEHLINMCNKDGGSTVNNNNTRGSSGGGGTEDNDTAGEPTDTTEEVYTAGGANEDGNNQGDPNSKEDDNMIEEEPTIKYFNINFNLKRQPNVAQELKGFVQEAIRTTKQEKIKFIASNRTTTPSPAPITGMSQYPETELKHE